ncbi:MAG: hypothetical protein WBY44_24985 [Bryobacteraceae bacterium]|jgi:HTH-type transcriptional regulator / antitoxin HigA
MPVTYEDLLMETLPARIETDEEYDRIDSHFTDLFGRKRLTAAEKRLMNLLGVLIQDYDKRDPLPREGCSPAELLQFLVDQSGQSASALLTPIFGQRSHVYEALNGKRPIQRPPGEKTRRAIPRQPRLVSLIRSHRHPCRPPEEAKVRFMVAA